MRKTTSFLLLNAFLFALVIVTNTLANALPINGMNTGQISDMYPSLFTPAGFTFSVWGLLYLLQLSFVIVQFSIRQATYFEALSKWCWISCVANSVWILTWHYLFVPASVVVMLVLLFSLTKIFVLLHSEKLNTWKETVFVKLTFTFYLSWICVATIANIATLLVDQHWNGGFLSQETWTITMIIIAACLGLFIAFNFKEPFFLLILMWAFFGIYSKWSQTEHQLIATFAEIAAVVLALMFVKLVIDKRRIASERLL
jgi:hypothetical protein